MTFVISNGPDEEWFIDADEAFEAALEWSASMNGDSVLVSVIKEGKFLPLSEVFT